MKKTKSPLTDNPLRYVAQSTDEKISNVFDDKILFPLIIIGVLILTTILEWYHYYNPPKVKPILITIIYILIVVFCIIKLIRSINFIKKLKLGRDGERAVGQYLESNKDESSKLFHDIVGNGFNIDHLLISRKGIFVIETKTYSKPLTGKAVITYNDNEILINGKPSIKNILSQIQGGTSYIKNLIKESTGISFEPFPVVLFPGWYIEGNGNKTGNLWVLNPKALKVFIENQQNMLKPEEVNLVSYHISRHIRTSK